MRVITNVELTTEELGALGIISQIDCSGVECVRCPLCFKMYDNSKCIKDVCQHILQTNTERSYHG